ncbi:unnamed protein product [Paramecium pentaurelia]|uniref:Phospholipid scramblase n=1 Tax=Paramecium pentaurelia TaxID=43138 RepID=A0A8S1WRV8_9CILI|nr:unnamed protein product [Paramecium pentaurelia]
MQSPLNTDDSIGQNNFYQMADYIQSPNQTSCLDILETQVGIFVQQRFEFFQVMIGITTQCKIFTRVQTPNVFRVYAANDQGQQIEEKELFKYKKKSSACARLTLGPPYRPFEMFVSNYWCKDFQPNMDQLFQENSDRIVFRFDRQYACTCCCLNRLLYLIIQNKSLGYIIQPYYCFTLGCHIYDSQDKLKQIIEGSCCQCYFCVDVHAVINVIKLILIQKLQSKQLNQLLKVVAPMKKQIKGCCQNWANITDNIFVVFPQNASKEDKTLILAATIFLITCILRIKMVHNHQIESNDYYSIKSIVYHIQLIILSLNLNQQNPIKIVLFIDY